MKQQLAFVLGGGGARGALQVGALQALSEAGIYPDILVGTSIGAVNSSFVALRGMQPESLSKLVESWHDAMHADLLPANYVWLTMRALLNRPTIEITNRMKHFFIAHGLVPEIQFKDVQGVRLATVSADLNTSRLVVFGKNVEDSILEGVLASTAIPPWVPPVEKDGQLLIDGGFISTLPIETALGFGATEIIALDISDPRRIPVNSHGFGPFMMKIINMAEQRQTQLELSLALSHGIHVLPISLRGVTPSPLWDFSHTDELIAQGYESTRAQLTRRQTDRRPRWFAWFFDRWPAQKSLEEENRKSWP